LARGERLTEILKQNQYQPVDVIKQIVLIFAGTQGFIDDLPVSEIRVFERELYQFLDAAKAPLLQKIASEKTLSDALRQGISAALKEFKEKFVAERAAAN